MIYSIGRLDTDDLEEIAQLPEWNRGKYKKHLTRSDKFPYVSDTIENVIWNADCVRAFSEGIITEGIVDGEKAKEASFFLFYFPFNNAFSPFEISSPEW